MKHFEVVRQYGVASQKLIERYNRRSGWMSRYRRIKRQRELMLRDLRGAT